MKTRPGCIFLFLLLACMVLTDGYAAETKPLPGYVLPPQAGSVLKEALYDSVEAGKSSLGLQEVALKRDHVQLTLAPARGRTKTPITVTLWHPTKGTGALALTPAFSVHGKGVKAARLKILLALLNPIKSTAVWIKPKPSKRSKPSTGTPSKPRSVLAIPPGFVKALHAAKQAVQTGVAAEAPALLAPFIKKTLPAPSRVEIASVLWQAGKRGQALALVKDIRAEKHGVMLNLQAQLLRGKTLGSAEVIKALTKARKPCDGLRVVHLLQVQGTTSVAKEVAVHLGRRNPPCVDALATQVDWQLSSGDVQGAATLSRDLLAKYPKSNTLLGVRTRVLIAAGRAKEASKLLEERIFADPKSVNVSSLLGAYNRVHSVEWKRNKMRQMVDRAKANPKDHLAALIAGVLLHYDGQLAASNTLLNPLLNTPLNDEARLFIYLGMNAFDLGDAKKGLAYIDRAMGVSWPDPDVYYCRAEILRMNDPKGARDALKRYIAQTRPSPTQNTAKRARVNKLLDNLNQCVAEKRTTPCPGPWEHPRGEGVSLFDYRTGYKGSNMMVYIIAALFIFGGVGIWLFRRRRRS